MATKKTQKRRRPNSPSVNPIARSPIIGATTWKTSSALFPGTPPTNITGLLARDMPCLPVERYRGSDDAYRSDREDHRPGVHCHMPSPSDTAMVFASLISLYDFATAQTIP